MRRDKRTSDEERILRTCPWCQKWIAEDSEVFGFGLTVKPGVDLSSREGSLIQISLARGEKTIYAMVTSSDSQAKRQGKDLMFWACSRRCADHLKRALEEERDTFDLIH